jgi:acyl-CoA thioesterase YciA
MNDELSGNNQMPALRTLAMPADANPNGDIFGGWVLSQMDLAGAAIGVKRARGRVATVAIDAMRFHRPIFVGDMVSCYARILEEGTTSMQIHVETWVERSAGDEVLKVTEGRFVYVAIDDEGKKRPLPKVE